MTPRFVALSGLRARWISGFGLLAWTSLAIAGTPNSMNVVNNGMSSWTIDGQTNPPLTLLRGQTYEFVMQSVSAVHPFNINTTNSTGSANLYNDGVTNNGASGTQTLTFVVPGNAPDSLHYNCGNHAAMNGPITIVTDLVFADGFDPLAAGAP
ncbi:MAG: hypothetical protein OJJ21_12675 [Ferrovibrio sp.]|uniref:hypothetical protein n=1 Tax=Ferrovibrio sp. TaxID=1917215 RepID=UPI0026090385|nr:hypothetical protein [Ferrovibrio sp.]MCW0234446.1 hypothetical protein [Ferrovibrio sp.]